MITLNKQTIIENKVCFYNKNGIQFRLGVLCSINAIDEIKKGFIFAACKDNGYNNRVSYTYFKTIEELELFVSANIDIETWYNNSFLVLNK